MGDGEVVRWLMRCNSRADPGPNALAQADYAWGCGGVLALCCGWDISGWGDGLVDGVVYGESDCVAGCGVKGEDRNGVSEI